ncbi:hypothetical protein LMG29542_07881 [Paraburkholderia humisilvae]|uniref:DUF6537 domain-containing protein n=1 Tax=Paraburkholderia humisilvae TaxID=627669 RepID=A0A6J5F7N4_9BURK|nr:hypothetical protein LMG29542_07881 [Paraburkholderia humisilvae]
MATRFLGDTIGANILMLGFAWQLGLVPVSFAAMMRVIELNNVAVQMNQLAFSIGRLAAADPASLDTMWQQRHANKQVVPLDTVDALVADREARLLAYGGTAYVKRYRALVDAARHAERKLERAHEARLTRSVAMTFYRLLAVKDEYEVARLHRDPAFRSALETQFGGVAGKDFRVKFNLAPPTILKARNGVQPKTRSFGQWVWPVFGAIAKCRNLRGTMLDPFGRTIERQMERELSADYEMTMQRAFVMVNDVIAEDIIKLADLYARVRGYGHVKLMNLAAVKRSERELAARVRIEAATGAAVKEALAKTRSSGTLDSIPVVVIK